MLKLGKQLTKRQEEYLKKGAALVKADYFGICPDFDDEARILYTAEALAMAILAESKENILE